MSTIENNKILAQFEKEQYSFLGWVLPDRARMVEVKINIWEESEIFKDSELLYHSSWDWLMPVAKKIDTIVFGLMVGGKLENKSPDETLLKITGKDSNIIFHQGRLFVSSDIEEAYNACVEFIKWYNEQSK